MKQRCFRLNAQGRQYLKDLGLHPRQVEACEKLVMHNSEQDAADAMFIDIKTVKFHKTAIYKALKVKCAKEMLLFLYEFMDVHYINDNVPAYKPKQIKFPNPLPMGITNNEH